MAWRCSYGVENCPICKRHEATLDAKRKAEKVLKRIQDGLTNGSIKAIVKNGKVTFVGVQVGELDGATEECVYRAIMVSGSALAKAAIAKAQQQAGPRVIRI